MGVRCEPAHLVVRDQSERCARRRPSVAHPDADAAGICGRRARAFNGDAGWREGRGAGGVGKKCPAYVFGNDEDHAYGRFLLDERSRAAVVGQAAADRRSFSAHAAVGRASGTACGNPACRLLEYAELSLRLLPAEKDAELAISILGHLRTTYTSYLSEAQRSAFAERLEALLIGQMAGAPTADLRISNFRALVAVGTTSRARSILKDLLAGRATIPGVPLKQRDRWNIIAALVGAERWPGPELLASEREHDQTEDGRKYAYVAGAGYLSLRTRKNISPSMSRRAAFRRTGSRPVCRCSTTGTRRR